MRRATTFAQRHSCNVTRAHEFIEQYIKRGKAYSGNAKVGAALAVLRARLKKRFAFRFTAGFESGARGGSSENGEYQGKDNGGLKELHGWYWVEKSVVVKSKDWRIVANKSHGFYSAYTG